MGTVLSTLESLRLQGVPAVSLSSSESTQTMDDALAEAREYAADIDLDLIWDLAAPYSTRNPIALELEVPPVGAGRAWLYVEPDGDVLPAQGVQEVLGNFLRDEWSVIWSLTQG